MVLIGIIVALLMFTLIVVIHELWHFLPARKFWVKVYEFGIWMPPKAKKLYTDKKWTNYILNYLPFWWYVKLAWENLTFFKIYNENWEKLSNEDIESYLNEGKQIYDEDWNEIPINDVSEIRKALEENKASYSLVNKAYWKQIIIILGWVFMNFMLSIAIFSVLFMVWVKPLWINTKIDTQRDVMILPTYEQALEEWIILKGKWLILSPTDDSIAKKSGILDWDIVLKVENTEIKNFQEFTNILSQNKWQEINFEVLRWEDKIDIKITPSDEWKIWSYVWENVTVNEDFEYKFWPIESIWMWVKETYNQSMLTLEWLWFLVWNIFSPEKPEDRTEAINSVSWPIWIVWIISQTFTEWIVFIMIIWAIISINLWVFNLLPIPALDWWRFLFILINSFSDKVIKKKVITPQIEWVIHILFFMLLIILSILIAFKDIKNLIF